MKIRYHIIISFLMLALQDLMGQEEDAKWLLGYSSGPTSDTNFGRIIMSFSDTSIMLNKNYQVKHKMDFTNSSICDSSGNLLCYTNGLEIYDRNFNIMPNGDDINKGFQAERNERLGYTNINGTIILPWPDRYGNYLLIHNIIDRTILDSMPWQYYSLNLLTTLIDMRLRSGLGDVVYKNQSVFSDSTCVGTLSACRHSNGRDWWINVLRFSGEQIFTFLFDPSGIKLYKIQKIPIKIVKSNSGQAVYNPQGNKFALFMQNDSFLKEFILCDFDRCTGKISNCSYGRDTLFENVGLAFSPSGRFLYLSTADNLYQLDMEDSMPFDKKILIDSIDKFKSGPFYYAYFSSMQLAPNNKIYISPGRGSRHLGVIDRPDLKGKECRLLQHYIDLGMYNSTIPNIPFFRLGSEKGSECDSLGIVNTEFTNIDIPSEITLFPTPSHDYINFKIKSNKFKITKVSIYDFTGNLIYYYNYNSDLITIKTTDWRPGIYYYSAVLNNRLPAFGKLLLN